MPNASYVSVLCFVRCLLWVVCVVPFVFLPVVCWLFLLSWWLLSVVLYAFVHRLLNIVLFVVACCLSFVD